MALRSPISLLKLPAAATMAPVLVTCDEGRTNLRACRGRGQAFENRLGEGADVLVAGRIRLAYHSEVVAGCPFIAR